MPDSGHHHDHDNGQGHNSGHGHSHAPKNFGAAFAIGTALNAGFVIAEVVAGLFSHSMALLADAGHNLGDVLGLLMAWGAAKFATRIPSARFTYGLRRGTILAALANAIILLISVGAIATGAVARLISPSHVGTIIVMAVAAAGILVNGTTALLFASGRKGDLNIRAAFQHMAYDAALSFGVVVAGALILLTGWERLDPVMSLIIAAVIVAGTWSLLRDSMSMAMDAVPGDIRPEAVRSFVLTRPEIASVHDLHIWSMSTTETALTLHLVAPAGHPGDAFLARLCDDLHDEFDIDHATVQIETNAAQCSLACGQTV